eukprot:XP_011679445.1 PREDICTED: low-density lipoprotein receptor-related protein 5-like [Strongylocentrotus purpuratus]
MTFICICITVIIIIIIMTDSIVFVTDLDEGAIFMATTTNLTFTKLPLTGLQTPVAVDYDPVDGIVYWTDSSNRSINSARINGTNQKTVIDGLGTPDGMYFDVQTKTIYWTDALHNTIEAVHHNGTGRHNILSDLDKPRAIIIVSTNRFYFDIASRFAIDCMNSRGVVV